MPKKHDKRWALYNRANLLNVFRRRRDALWCAGDLVGSEARAVSMLLNGEFTIAKVIVTKKDW